MIKIHETAVVHPGAEIGEGCEVGPYSVIGPNVEIGPRNWIANHVTLMGKTRIGSDNRIFPNTVLGAAPQDLKYRGEETLLEIGSHNQIREFVTVNCGTVQGGGITRLGDSNLLMACSHVAHDCILEDHVILANNVLLAGHIVVGTGAIVSGAAAIHHFATVGRLAFVGAMTRIRQDVPPFMIVEGNPARVRGINTVGMQRHGIPEERVKIVKRAYRLLYHANIPRREALEELQAWNEDTPELTELFDFYKRMEHGVKGRAREALRQA
jgi:UDP-N-acetylglucosamine acyltransferase